MNSQCTSYYSIWHYNCLWTLKGEHRYRHRPLPTASITRCQWWLRVSVCRIYWRTCPLVDDAAIEHRSVTLGNPRCTRTIVPVCFVKRADQRPPPTFTVLLGRIKSDKFIRRTTCSTRNLLPLSLWEMQSCRLYITVGLLLEHSTLPPPPEKPDSYA